MAGLFTSPLGWACLLGLLASAGALASLTGLRRRGTPGWAPLAWFAAWLVTMAAASPFTASVASWSLERVGGRWPPHPAWAGQPPDMIVVFCAGVRGAAGRETRLSTASLERLHAALAAARRWPDAAVLFSGGSRQVGHPAPARLMTEEAIGLGLPRERILVDEQALNTRENALRTVELLAARSARRVLLVTSREHAVRARAALWRLGVAAELAPSNPSYRAPLLFVNLLPDAEALERTGQAVREALGLAVYGLRGWIGPPSANGVSAPPPRR